MSLPFNAIDSVRMRGWDARSLSALVGITALAALVRLVFFTGFFGSDELTYTDVAFGIANGHLNVSNYIGALRYGVNLPSALFIALFGASEISADLWSLLCSVGEVALIFVLAYRLWGIRGALLSSTVIMLLPLHVHYGGRLMADAPLAFFITLSFVLFWAAEKRQSSNWYFVTGLAAGLVFWIKEVVSVYYVAFVLYALAYRTWRFKWIWVGIGIATAVGANCALFWLITGDPLYMYGVIRAHTAKQVQFRGQIESSPWYYLRYLFADMRHTWLMTYLAVAGIMVWASKAYRTRVLDTDTGYVVVWGISLFVVFSFVVISIDPLIFIAKQTNYMLIFVAPFCLLAGYFLASLPRGWMLLTLGGYLGGAVILAGLEQQAIRVFTANSRATVAFARDHADLPVYAMTNGYRAGRYAELLDRSAANEPSIRSMSELFQGAGPPENVRIGPKGYAVIDLQTMDWGRQEPIRKISDIPPCWRRTSILEPAPGSGIGYHISTWMLATAHLLPSPLSDRVIPALDALVRPKPAYVYLIPEGCNQ